LCNKFTQEQRERIEKKGARDNVPQTFSMLSVGLFLMASGVTAILGSFEVRSFRGRMVHLLRDDLFQLSEGVRGNKARKFSGLKFEGKKCLVSYGGIQSNSMYALSCFSRKANKSFVYYTKGPIPAFLKSNSVNRSTISNFNAALSNGMRVIELDNDNYQRIVDQVAAVQVPVEGIPESMHFYDREEVLWVPQGGACVEAEMGCHALASTITDYVSDQQTRQTRSSKNWVIAMASGTGTTALFTHRALQQLSGVHTIKVAAVPCVGSESYLSKQMEGLDSVSGRFNTFPTILQDDRTRVFAKPYQEHIQLWNELRLELGVNFDLVYSPRAWEVLLSSDFWSSSNTEIIYYCCGGDEGNDSQLARYKRLNINVH